MTRTRSVLMPAAAAAIVLVSMPAWAAPPVPPEELVESSAFLDAYRLANSGSNVEFYDLYSDRARVHVRTSTQESEITFDGRLFKRWGRELLESGRIGLEGSVFRDATVEQRGSRLIIRAKRYSTAHCYGDDSYQMSIEREGVSYRIVEERLSTNPQSHCRDAVPLLAFIPMAPAPTLSVTGTSLDLAAPTSPATWHPLSEAELAAQALRIAQQIAAARAAPSSASPVAAGIVPASLTAASSESILPTQERGEDSKVRITPTERP